MEIKELIEKLAIYQLYKGLTELVLYGDNRRLLQHYQYVKIGFIFLITLGKVKLDVINYYKYPFNND